MLSQNPGVVPPDPIRVSIRYLSRRTTQGVFRSRCALTRAADKQSPVARYSNLAAGIPLSVEPDNNGSDVVVQSTPTSRPGRDLLQARERHPLGASCYAEGVSHQSPSACLSRLAVPCHEIHSLLTAQLIPETVGSQD